MTSKSPAGSTNDGRTNMAGEALGSVGNPVPSPGPLLRVLVDTNVVLDVLLAREPWASQARQLFDTRDKGRVTLYLGASTLTDIFYICRKQVGIDRARAAVGECLRRYIIVPVDRAILDAALALPGADFEDNVQMVSAQAAHLDLIVTRNTADYTSSPVPAIEPQTLAARLAMP